MLVRFASLPLKLGKAVEGPTDSRGCGIVAGCGRSGSMARGLVGKSLPKLRSFVRDILGRNNSLLDIPAPALSGPGSSGSAAAPALTTVEGKGVETEI